MKRRRISLLLAAAAALAGASASAQEDPTNIVADQIRAQLDRNSPQSAKRDAQASIPGEAVWILQCESGSYRVELTPDMAATVERLAEPYVLAIRWRASRT